MEGRDIGTKVFPDAQVKIFLDAAAEVRGQRRYQQNGPGAAQAESVLQELRERDRRDRTRAESPLQPASDAVIIDSTDLSLDEVVHAGRSHHRRTPGCQRLNWPIPIESCDDY